MYYTLLKGDYLPLQNYTNQFQQRNLSVVATTIVPLPLSSSGSAPDILTIAGNLRQG